MKKIIMILSIILLMGCTSLNYKTQKLYTQKDLETGAMAGIGLGVASVLFYQHITEIMEN